MESIQTTVVTSGSDPERAALLAREIKQLQERVYSLAIDLTAKRREEKRLVDDLTEVRQSIALLDARGKAAMCRLERAEKEAATLVVPV